eukprot:9123849-Alexandrium_andersonii.AAC.1
MSASAAHRRTEHGQPTDRRRGPCGGSRRSRWLPSGAGHQDAGVLGLRGGPLDHARQGLNNTAW